MKTIITILIILNVVVFALGSLKKKLLKKSLGCEENKYVLACKNVKIGFIDYNSPNSDLKIAEPLLNKAYEKKLWPAIKKIEFTYLPPPTGTNDKELIDALEAQVMKMKELGFLNIVIGLSSRIVRPWVLGEGLTGGSISERFGTITFVLINLATDVCRENGIENCWKINDTVSSSNNISLSVTNYFMPAPQVLLVTQDDAAAIISQSSVKNELVKQNYNMANVQEYILPFGTQPDLTELNKLIDNLPFKSTVSLSLQGDIDRDKFNTELHWRPELTYFGTNYGIDTVVPPVIVYFGYIARQDVFVPTFYFRYLDVPAGAEWNTYFYWGEGMGLLGTCLKFRGNDKFTRYDSFHSTIDRWNINLISDPANPSNNFGKIIENPIWRTQQWLY